MAEQSLYHTYVVNHDGLTGESYVEGNQGLALGVSSSLLDAPGTNPEQFIGFALSTCFNATLRIVEKREKLPADSQVRTRVDITQDKTGYQFLVHAQLLFKQIDRSTATQVVAQALNECPVAKLLKDNPTVSFEIVDSFNEEPALGE